MIKYGRNLNSQAVNRAHKLWISRQNQSTKSVITPAAKKGIAAGIIIGGTCGTLGYVNYSPEFRHSVESFVPGSSTVFTALFGQSIYRKLEPPIIPSQQESLLKKKLERESQKQPVKKIDAEAPVIKESKSQPEKDKSAKEKCTDETPSAPIVEDVTSSKNESLSQKLQDMVLNAQQQAETTVELYEDTKSTVKLYLQKVHEAIDMEDGDKSLFEEAKQLAQKKNDAMKLLDEKVESVQKCLEEIQSVAQAAKEDASTKDNSTLSLVENFLSEASSTKQKIIQDSASLMKESVTASDLQSLIEQGLQKFQEEIKMLVPKLDEGGILEKEREEMMNILIAHAHKRVLALQKELAKHMVARQRDSPRFEDHEQRISDRRMQSELQRQEHQLSMDHRHRMSQMREDFESELRSQLKRQAAAHSDHLADKLLEQDQQLQRIWKNRLDDSLEKEREVYLAALAKLDGQLTGLNEALETRAKIDEAAHHSHELWMKCQSLKNSLRLGNPDSQSWEDQLRPLQKDVDALKVACGSDDSFVGAVVGSLPKEALTRGVFTESALKERFIKVERVCARVAMVGDNGGSLVRYFVSYLRSFLLMGAFEKLPESENTEIDVENLDVYDILARTRYCLEKDDLLQSVRYMKLMRGEAKHVAKDWIKEALMTLEAQQAADVLMSYATATGTKAL